MGRKISEAHPCGHHVLFCFSLFFFFLRPIIYFFNFKHCVSIVTIFFKILSLLTLLKQGGA